MRSESLPKTTGTGAHSTTQSKTGCANWVTSAAVRMARAAGGPIPFAEAVKTPGATGSTSTMAVTVTPCSPVTSSEAGPVATAVGRTTSMRVFDAELTDAGCSTPAKSRMRTDGLGPSAEPDNVTSSEAATAPEIQLAELRTPPDGNCGTPESPAIESACRA